MDKLSPCKHCERKCCKDLETGYRVEHLGADFYLHTCDFCDDGNDYYEKRRDDMRFAAAHGYAFNITSKDQRVFGDTLTPEAELKIPSFKEKVADSVRRLAAYEKNEEKSATLIRAAEILAGGTEAKPFSEKEKLVQDFINVPLRAYLTGEISFGKFKEMINETCGTNFSYDDLYPSYLFNGAIHYPMEKQMIDDIKEKK